MGFSNSLERKIVSPYVKYEVEMAKNGKGLVHIRCCYNNKYWVYADDAKTIVRFRHVQLGHNACLWRAAPPHESCLFAGSAQPDKDRCDVYTIIDWESLLILPKHIAFKGDNGNYLSARWIEGSPISAVRIQRHWRSNSWERDDTTSNNSDTLFWPIKVDNNIVALRNLGNNNFCKRLTTEGKTNCLNAAVSIHFQRGTPGEGKVEISAEFSGAYQWGETQSSTTVMETVYKVTVPPMTMVKVSLLATKGSCDVPFSYSQRDTLINGQQTTHHMDDGVYTGMNCFNFKYETKQEKL
ncbi:hypothetical protein Acr_09g0008640 [Actinidia rufa]|uniref:Agglutinin domain-containing protein n=1 Tax=Actinidia rufa TaxID=165716 RepID=A0A7J0F6U0_9ERIC|nr:hypothetical protein Acr_09g0008640 [Actinidia rufa]